MTNTCVPGGLKYRTAPRVVAVSLAVSQLTIRTVTAPGRSLLVEPGLRIGNAHEGCDEGTVASIRAIRGRSVLEASGLSVPVVSISAQAALAGDVAWLAAVSDLMRLTENADATLPADYSVGLASHAAQREFTRKAGRGEAVAVLDGDVVIDVAAASLIDERSR